MAEPKRHCVVCKKGFFPPADALHKRFCSASCRNQFHSRERKEAVELLRKTKALPAKEPANG